VSSTDLTATNPAGTIPKPWRPGLVVTIPGTAPASTYTATITHSVA